MARARIEYQFGQLVEIEETESKEVENVKNKFKEYGINVPLLAGKFFILILGLKVYPVISLKKYGTIL